MKKKGRQRFLKEELSEVRDPHIQEPIINQESSC